MSAIQTRDGYIWVGTWDGFARFDGASFTRFDVGRTSGLIESSATALCESPDGALWIGHSSGAVSRMSRGEITYYPAASQREGYRIQNLACDGTGDVWACDVAGHLIRVRDGLTLIPDTGTADGIFFMGASSNGELAVVSRGKLSILRHGQLYPVQVRADMDPFIRGVCSRRDGGWWVVQGGRLWKWYDGEWTELDRAIPTGSSLVYAMTEMSDGRLLGATYDAGAWTMHPTEPIPDQLYNHANGFASDWITSVFEGREGGLWLGTGTAGLCRIAKKAIGMLTSPDVFGGRPVLSVAEGTDGALWMGTEGNGVYRYQEGKWTRFGLEAGLSHLYVWSVATTEDGAVWAGTWGGGVFRFEDERFLLSAISEGMGNDQVATMIASARGGLLVGGGKGIHYWRGNRVEWLERAPNRVATDVRTLLEENAGDVIWAGSWGRGLTRFGPTGTRQYTREEGLPSNDINCLYRDRGGALWIGTNGGGLARLKDERIIAINSSHGLSDNSIGHIAEDGSGNFWLTSRSGLMRVEASQLNACAEGTLPELKVETFGYSDGLTTLNFSASVQPTACVLRNGQMAFATERGVAVLDPMHLPRNREPPLVHIESVTVGDQAIDIGVDPAGSFEVPAGFERLEIKYAALCFAGPEKVMFSRQLFPLERRPTLTRNERSVAYDYLPPGNYTFRFAAANNDGVWNPDMRSISFVVLPYYWETGWFRILVASLLVAIGGAIAWRLGRRRLQRRVERLEREHAIERERTRIANDMHDELGAQLTRITMLSESAQRQSADPVRVGERLDQIYETAHSVTKSMDEIVWTVNPRHDTLESLVTYLETYAVDFLGTARIGCRIDAPFETIDWMPNAEVRHNLFLCLKEALTNVVRHAGATMVVVTIRADDGEFFLQVADNGCGLRSDSTDKDSHPQAGGGDGTQNLHSRMRRIGGACSIKSSPESGCTVAFTIPL